jgi:hypothetical protein
MAATDHYFLKPAVQQALGLQLDAQGNPVLDAQGNPVLAPDVAQVYLYAQQMRQELDVAKAAIQQFLALLNGKASADSLAAVRQNVTTLTSTVAGKADTTYVEQQFQANYDLDTTQTNAIRAAQDLLATDGGLLANLLAGQQTLTNQVSGLRADVDLKAAAATVSTLTGQVTSLRNTITDPTAGLVATNTLAATANTEANKRLLRSGDTATGPIVVPTATNKIAAPRFEQVFGGINSPRRTMENITTGTTELQPLTDTTGQNRKILPIGVLFLLMGNQPSGTVTVKLGTTPGGAELYTKTYSLLTGLLGKVLAPDLPASATPLPAGQRLYATVTGGGLWTCFFDAVFLPTAS